MGPCRGWPSGILVLLWVLDLSTHIEIHSTNQLQCKVPICPIDKCHGYYVFSEKAKISQGVLFKWVWMKTTFCGCDFTWHRTCSDLRNMRFCLYVVLKEYFISSIVEPFDFGAALVPALAPRSHLWWWRHWLQLQLLIKLRLRPKIKKKSTYFFPMSIFDFWRFQKFNFW